MKQLNSAEGIPLMRPVNIDTPFKSLDWLGFSVHVRDHIEGYVVPQYGDKGDDPASDYSVDDCIKQVQKYAARYGKNARPGQEKLDLMKMAHYIQMAYTQLEREQA